MAPGKGGKRRSTENRVQAANVRFIQPSIVSQETNPMESEQADPVSPLENSAAIPPKRVRGPTRGIGLEKLIKGKNKLVIDIPTGKGRPVCELQSAKLSSEIGVISRQFIPVPTRWKDLKNEDKFHALERLNTKFQMKLDDDYVKTSVMSILSKMSRNQRYRLHLHFKKFPNAELARQNNPTKYNLSQENWEALCDMFSSPDYQIRCETNAKARKNVKFTHNQGSRAFVASRYTMRKDEEEPNRMEFFKATHYSEHKGWSTPEAEAAYNKMEELQSNPIEEGTEPKSIDAIVDEVLGTRSVYIKGLGYGPKPTAKMSNATVVELKESLTKTQDELQHYKSSFDMLRAQMEALTKSVQVAGIQVTIPQFPVSNETNAPSIGSPSTQELD